MGKTCAQYRAMARQALKGKYWYAFGMCILVSIISGLSNGLTRLAMGSPDSSDDMRIILALIITIAFVLFVTIPLNIGLTRYFILNSKGRSDINELAYPYKNNLMNIITAVIKQVVFVYLWSLLFVIPGIVKSFSYYMVDFIIAENPYITSKRAFEISKKAMVGYKGKAFLLGLSFIGWILLSILTFGIGLLFLEPYMSAASAEFYLDVKESAFERGIILDGELPR